MTVKVFIWKPAITEFKEGPPDPSIGHASILIGHHYLSFWPIKVTFGIEAAIPSISIFNTYDNDVKSEYADPDETITLNNLNQKPMEDFYQWIKKIRPLYYARGFNCASPVKIALYLGSGRKKPNFKVYADNSDYSIKISGLEKLDRWARQCWNPIDVGRYAKYLRADK